MKYLTLDIGFSRVGTAVGDDVINLAFARNTLDYKDYITELEKIITEESIDALVVGIPNALNGKISDHVQKIQNEIVILKKCFSIPIHTFDEQFTTQIAEKSLSFMGIKSKKQKGKKDAMAAAIILQGFLDFQKNKK